MAIIFKITGGGSSRSHNPNEVELHNDDQFEIVDNEDTDFDYIYRGSVGELLKMLENDGEGILYEKAQITFSGNISNL